MAQCALFSRGIELASFVTSSGTLGRSWGVITSVYADIISEVGDGITCKLYKEPDSELTIIAFEATQDSSDLQADLIPSSALEKNLLNLDFLCSKINPILSVNTTAVSLFYKNHQRLDQLKSEIGSSPLIVTGHGLGGSVASLFTISLLDSIGSRRNRPLCITYGSPLIGDKNLQKAISRSSNWNSCFLHVVSHKDPLPRLFITNHNPSTAALTYMPFGTFLLCSDANSTCFENPESIMELLIASGTIHAHNQGFQSADYGNIVENLIRKVFYKDLTTRAENMTHPDSVLASSINLQLRALGLTPQHMQQQQQNMDINNLETKIKKLEFVWHMRVLFDPFKNLNLIKKYMNILELYKKAATKEQIGYYDCYKNQNTRRDMDFVELHKNLRNYWEKKVEEAEMMPPREGAAFRRRWLYAGTLYRRMVEPLAIAQYYKDGGKDYVNHKRSKHFVQLEEWFQDMETVDSSRYINTRKKNVETILTVDSCFWAHVEEALFSCKELKVVKDKEDTLKKLVEFEEYVYGLLKNYEVSPEIFLPQSSYMQWWNEYKAIKGTSYDSKLSCFMNHVKNHEQYALGAYDFPDA